MRHQKFSQRLSRPAGHRQATVRNLVINLLRDQRIKTTKAKAKFAQSLLERVISLGRQNTLHSRRHAYKILNDRIAVNQLFSKIAPLFKDRSSGFSRIVHYYRRRGDGAQLVFLELSQKLPKQKPIKARPEKPVEGRPPSEKAKKPEPEIKPEEKPKMPREKPRPAKKIKPPKFLGGLRKLFKKERDSL